MDKQDKFLDVEYLKTRLNDFREIKTGQVKYDIVKSNRKQSRTLYIYFYLLGSNGTWNKYYNLRISDHILAHEYNNFVITPNKYMNKDIKARFVKLVQYTIKMAQKRSLGITFRKL